LKIKKKHIRKAPRTKNDYECIDGNWTYHPAAYCTRYHGVLTEGLLNTHQCRIKQCRRLIEDKWE